MDPRLGLVEVAGDDMPRDHARRLEPGTGRGRWPWPNWPWATSWSAPPGPCWSWPGTRPGRIQFGQPIASFQAVRHRLAETLVAVEAADAALGSAWDEGSPASAARAKALAGRSARTATRHGQQVLAGIGFTTEHDFHHYVRRVLVLDQLFGTARALTRELGRQLLATRRLPPLPPLSGRRADV